MSAAMASEQPAPRFRWAAKNNRHHAVADGRLMTAAECAAWLENDPDRLQDCTATVVDGRTNCVAVTRPFLSKPVLYLGEHPSVAPGAGSEPDARRELIRTHAELTTEQASARRRVTDDRITDADYWRGFADGLGEALRRVDAAMNALAPSRSETAVEATK